jgi:hypothetical protein
MPGLRGHRGLDQRAHLGLDRGAVLLGDHAAVELEHHLAGHDVGVAAALDAADVQVGVGDARHRERPRAQHVVVRVQRGQQPLAACSASTPVCG